MDRPGGAREKIRGVLAEGETLYTPTGALFGIGAIDDTGIQFFIGPKRASTRLPWEAFEGAVEHLRGRGWVPTTGTFDTEARQYSLAQYLRQFITRETTNWVVAILEEAGLVEVDRSRPIRARLIT